MGTRLQLRYVTSYYYTLLILRTLGSYPMQLLNCFLTALCAARVTSLLPIQMEDGILSQSWCYVQNKLPYIIIILSSLAMSLD